MTRAPMNPQAPLVPSWPEPVPASDLTLVVPFRHDGPARRENLHTMLRLMAGMLDGAEILLLEDGPAPGPTPRGIAGLVHATCRNEGPFHRTRLLNHGLLTLARRPLVAAWDADVLALPPVMAAAMAMLREGAAAMVFAHDGRFVDLSGAARARLVAGGGPEALPVPPWPHRRRGWWSGWWPPGGGGDVRCTNERSVGGAVLFRQAALAAAGGYHEDFVSWGFEDAELVARMRRLGHSPSHATGGPLLHLAHPRRWRPRGWYAGNRANARLSARLSALDLAATEAMIATGATRRPSSAPLPTLRDASPSDTAGR